MIGKLMRVATHARGMQRVNMALARGAAGTAGRTVDPTDPLSWEFSGFSQGGEDGILDVLTRRLLDPGRYFVEIGASDGLENNTTWLAMARRYSGLWVEGDPAASAWAQAFFTPLNYGLRFASLFVTRESAAELVAAARVRDPDVFSLDIDGNDYHIAQAVLAAGLRPRVVVVEYNSAFGPDRPLTVPYQADFRVNQGHGSSLYYGCSLAAWRGLFGGHGYRFLTVDSNGLNAFFADPKAFPGDFLAGVRGLDFRECFSHTREYGAGWQSQFALLKGRELQPVGDV